MSSITPIQVPGTMQPRGHYSQAIVANGLVFVSGQLPSDLATGTPNVGSIEEQTEISLQNVGRILEAAGSGLEHAVQMTIYISRIEDWGAINGVYRRIMGTSKPARAIVPVLPLHHGTGIEIQCVAVLPSRRKSTRKVAVHRAGAKRPPAAARRRRSR